MKHKTIGLFILLAIWTLLVIFLPTKRSRAEAPTETPKVWTKQEIQNSIHEYATKYHVNEKVMNTVVSCESQYDLNTIGDGGKSYGLVQIHMGYWGKEVTPEMARDPDFALEFLAEKLSKGQGKLWTCYRINFK